MTCVKYGSITLLLLVDVNSMIKIYPPYIREPCMTWKKYNSSLRSSQIKNKEILVLGQSCYAVIFLHKSELWNSRSEILWKNRFCKTICGQQSRPHTPRSGGGGAHLAKAVLFWFWITYDCYSILSKATWIVDCIFLVVNLLTFEIPVVKFENLYGI